MYVHNFSRFPLWICADDVPGGPVPGTAIKYARDVDVASSQCAFVVTLLLVVVALLLFITVRSTWSCGFLVSQVDMSVCSQVLCVVVSSHLEYRFCNGC